jgi:hypothetical protein
MISPSNSNTTDQEQQMEEYVRRSCEDADRNLAYCALLLNILRRKNKFLVLQSNGGEDGISYIGYYYPLNQKQSQTRYTLLIGGVEEQSKTVVFMEIHDCIEEKMLKRIDWTYDNRQDFDDISKTASYGKFFGDFLNIQEELIALSGGPLAQKAEKKKSKGKEEDPLPYLRDPPDVIKAFGVTIPATATLLGSGKVEIIPEEFLKENGAKVGDYITRNPHGQIILLPKTNVH